VVKWLTRYVLLKLGLGWVLRLFGYSVVETLDQVIRRINSGKADRKARLVDLPRNELVQAYLNSDLFVLASKIEYSPLVLYEAAAAGLPFMSISVGNAAEIARWTGGGIVIDAPMDARGYTQVDPGQLCREMARLIAHPELLAKLGRHGRRSWEHRFTWDKIAALYEQVFEDVVRRSKVSA
jgi:glycosyltransferase involved in cell wall biosynthesis